MQYYTPYKHFFERALRKYDTSITNHNLSLIEDEDGKPQIELTILVAGINKNDISVTSTSDQIIIKVAEGADTKFSAVKTEERIPINFTNSGNFEGRKVNYEGASATVNNGLLKIFIPIFEENGEYKEIEVK